MKYQGIEVESVYDIITTIKRHIHLPPPSEKDIRQILLAGSFLLRKDFSTLCGEVCGETVIYKNIPQHACLQVDFLTKNIICYTFHSEQTPRYNYILGRKKEEDEYTELWLNGALLPEE